jgi:hypothetical protein
MLKPFHQSVGCPIGAAYRRGWLLSCVLVGCTATLPPAPLTLTQAPNCSDVRSGRLAWNAIAPSGLEPSEAQRQAIDEALNELAKQLSGAEIRSLSRAADSLTDENFSSKFQSADYAKTVGRVLDYRVLDMRHQTVADARQIRIEVEGRVCTDNLVDPPLIVAIGDTTGLSESGVRALGAALSRSLARDPRLALAEGMASTTYHDIEVRAFIDGPRFFSVDRGAAISSIQANLGPQAIDGVPRYATRVSLQATLEATSHESGLGFTETQTVERESVGSGLPSSVIIAEMERDAVQRAGQALADMLSEHVKNSDL